MKKKLLKKSLIFGIFFSFVSLYATDISNLDMLMSLNFNQKIDTLNLLIKTTPKEVLNETIQQDIKAIFMSLFYELPAQGPEEKLAFKKLLLNLLQSPLPSHEQRDYITKLVLPLIDPSGNYVIPTPETQHTLPVAEAKQEPTTKDSAKEQGRILQEPLMVPVITKAWVVNEDGTREQITDITFRTVIPETEQTKSEKKTTNTTPNIMPTPEENVRFGKGRRPRNKKSGIRRC